MITRILADLTKAYVPEHLIIGKLEKFLSDQGLTPRAMLMMGRKDHLGVRAAFPASDWLLTDCTINTAGPIALRSVPLLLEDMAKRGVGTVHLLSYYGPVLGLERQSWGPSTEVKSTSFGSIRPEQAASSPTFHAEPTPELNIEYGVSDASARGPDSEAEDTAVGEVPPDSPSSSVGVESGARDGGGGQDTISGPEARPRVFDEADVGAWLLRELSARRWGPYTRQRLLFWDGLRWAVSERTGQGLSLLGLMDYAEGHARSSLQAIPGRKLAPWAEVRDLAGRLLLESGSVLDDTGNVAPLGIAGQLTIVGGLVDSWDMRAEARLMLECIRIAQAAKRPLKGGYAQVRAITGVLCGDRNSPEGHAKIMKLVVYLIENKQVEEGSQGELFAV